MAIRITEENACHEHGIRCDRCGSGWSYCVYERFGFNAQPLATSEAFPNLDALLAAYQARTALVGTACRCGGSYVTEDRDYTWEYSFYVCEECGEDADEQYAMGAYAGHYCETPGCPGSWANAPVVGKDRQHVDWLDAGEDDGTDEPMSVC